MIVTVYVDQQLYDIDVPDELIRDAHAFYEKMDSDMDQGWQVSRQWIEQPDTLQRCQIVADKILSAFHNQDERMILLMTGYILSKMPKTRQIDIDDSGDISLTRFVD